MKINVCILNRKKNHCFNYTTHICNMPTLLIIIKGTLHNYFCLSNYVQVSGGVINQNFDNVFG